MDTRSKYATLPFVAIGEKDLYETDELPEEDQLPSREHPSHDASVTIIPCGTIEAFKRFASCESNQIESEQTDETPLKKYERLKVETQELLDLVDNDAIGGESGGLISKVQQLSLNLHQLNVSRFESGNTLECVYDHLDKPKSIDKTDANENVSQVKYELWFKPDLVQVNESTKFNALEQRIKRIETILGANDQKLSLLTSVTNDRNLMDSVQTLCSKVTHLDGTHLEKIDTRLHMITDKLSQLSDRKPQMEEIEKQSKVSELYDLVFKIDKCRASLPRIVERLEALNTLHEHAMQFSATLTYLDALQLQISESLNHNNGQLNAFRDSFEKNVESIKSILNDFDKRLNSLK